MKRHLRNISSKQLSGTTITEMLVVMIVSGILFLLLFDGLSIVRQYGRILDRHLSAQSGLLYSYQVLESMFERADSIRRNENEIWFYMSHEQTVERLYMDSTHLLLYQAECTDTLFAGLTGLELHATAANPSSIDSIYLSVRTGRDTVQLVYGLSSYHPLLINEYPLHEFDSQP